MTSPGSSGPPVFVDPSGRRGRRVRAACWALGAVAATYVALVVVSLVAPPGTARLSVPGLGPVLPGPGAVALDDGQGGRRTPERLLPSGALTAPQATAAPTGQDEPDREDAPSPSPTSGRPTSSPATVPSAATTPTPGPTPGPPSSPPATAAATRAPSAEPSAPAASRTPPGQARRPSPQGGRPSPTAVASPTPTAGPTP